MKTDLEVAMERSNQTAAFQKEISTLRTQLAAERAKSAELERLLAEAEKDTARLDTVLGLGAYQFSIIEDGKYELWVMQDAPPVNSDCFVGETKREAVDKLREAIDAAREETK